ncbi:MAG: cupin domain-containing protein, partial [Nanoarchaeota archaeon]
VNVVTGTNVFAHIDDKKGLIESLRILLDNNGVFIIEVPYLVDLIENMEYDTIYLDHLEYSSLKPLVNFFNKNDMEIFDVEIYEIHGKSIRVFVCKRGERLISPNVDKLLILEEEKGIYKKDILDKFSDKIKEHKKEFISLLIELKKQGKKIVGISAPAKGNTILNYCKIDSSLIDYMAEKSIIKQGHFTPGMHIPILGEEEIYEDSRFPDYGIIFAWNFAREIMENNKKFIERGGKFIIPIPKPIIMEFTNDKEFEENKDLFGVKIEKINPVRIDERGTISDLLNKNINHVGLIITEKGAVRGAHYNKFSTQYSYILSGKFEVLLAHSNQPHNLRKVILHAGELITIPKNIIHSFKAVDRATFMINMVSKSREGNKYEEEVIKVDIDDPNEDGNQII